MMDNYEQTRLSNDRLKNIHQINFQEKTEFFECVDNFELKTQNFQFGANILNTTTATAAMSSTPNTSGSCSNEEETKTNGLNSEIKTITLTPSATTNELQLTSSIVDTPVSVEDEEKEDDCSASEEQDNSECCGDNGEAHYDDEEDSYQTDDNELSQISQDLGNSTVQQLSRDYEDDEDNPDEDEDSDDSSSDSDFSDLSGLSDMSGREWKPISHRPLNWVQKQIHSGVNPREILSKFLPTSAQRISPELTDMTLWRILASMLSEPPRRKKLSYVNTFDDVIDLVEKSKNIIVLTGAGVSVSCGIPDFRSSDGIYSRLAKDFPNLPDPQAMFDINYFSRDPRPFFKFAREIYPGQFKPSPCHRFIRMLEQKQKLLRNYTQNIDTLEQVAGIQNVIECHGSFSTASCTKCKYKCDADSIRADIFAQRIPVCPRCQPNVEQSVDASQPVSEMELRLLVENGIMKPDIVFFGEGLPDEFHTVMASDKDKCDLLIVMGSSLKVRPVALIPSSIPNNVPQILINREQLHHLEFDVELLGDGDVVINQICHRLGKEWKDICFDEEILTESNELMNFVDDEDVAKEIPASSSSTDNDSLSVKSSQSTELMLQSGATYSDSGFESSSASSSKKNVEFLPPDYLEDPIESSGFGGSCDYRHLSIDSSKDSGILGDASNPAIPPVFNSFPDSGDLNKSSLNMPASTTQAISNKSAPDNLHNTKRADTNCLETEKQCLRRQRRQQSAADRLHKGTYYAHDLSASYVFPGAQVSWCSESEDDLDEDEINGTTGKNLESIEDDDETNHAPLSPLMTPSVENEMVKAITSSSHTSSSSSFAHAISSSATSSTSYVPQQQNQKKRLSAESECSSTTLINATLADVAASSINSPPPHKKRRDSSDANTASSSTCVMSSHSLESS